MTAIKTFSPSATWDEVQAEERKHYQERFDMIRTVHVKSEGIGELIPMFIMAAVPFIYAFL